MRYRVALDATQLPALGAGVSTYVLNLARELSVLPKRAFDLVIIAKQVDAELFSCCSPAAEVATVNLHTRPHRLIWEQTGLPLLVARRGIHLVHSPHYSVPLMGKVRRVVTFHDLTYVRMPEYHSWTRRWYFRRLIPWAARTADHIVCDSLQTQRDLHAFCPWLPEAKSTCVPLGIAPEYLEPVTPQRIRHVRDRYGLTENYVLHVGTIEPRKNIETALTAIELLNMEGVRLRLVLAGQPGWESKTVYEKLERSPLCRVLGYVPAADLPPLYAGSEGLVMPSHYEGFGFPVLEAMAVGAPVVCSGKGSLREVGGDAALVPESDTPDAYATALRTILARSSDRESRVVRGRSWARRFSWRATAEATAAVYYRVMHGGLGHAPHEDAVSIRDPGR
jgi:glycosyltransferase involved in cell wall biosynthesis